MKINELRTITKLSQRDFAKHFGIPIGTLRNWEQGITNPPDYIFQMIFTSIRRDKMINVETIKFIKMIDELALLSNKEILPFEKATQFNKNDFLFYNNKIGNENEGYKVVLDSCIVDEPDIYHHDIISYYDSDNLEYKVRVFIDNETGPYISVFLLISEEEIIIQDGSWYFV